ncbi:MAG: hypothetical protein ACTHJ4_08250 [Candidatus Nucleicultricaceae bacterium]
MKTFTTLTLSLILLTQATAGFATRTHDEGVEENQRRMHHEIHVLHESSRTGQATEEQVQEVQRRYGHAPAQPRMMTPPAQHSVYSLEN